MADGSIRVFPDALRAAAGELEHAAHEGLELRGNFTRAGTAAGACDPAAAEGYQLMQEALARSLEILQAEVGKLGPKTGQAGGGYAATERSLVEGFGGGGS